MVLWDRNLSLCCQAAIGPIVLKKSVLPDCSRTDWWKCLFCAQLREIWARNPLHKV